jgi:hypothetical protein
VHLKEKTLLHESDSTRTQQVGHHDCFALVGVHWYMSVGAQRCCLSSAVFTCVLQGPTENRSLFSQNLGLKAEQSRQATEALTTRTVRSMPLAGFHRVEHYHYRTRDHREHHRYYDGPSSSKRARTSSRERERYDRRHQAEPYHAADEQTALNSAGEQSGQSGSHRAQIVHFAAKSSILIGI